MWYSGVPKCSQETEKSTSSVKNSAVVSSYNGECVLLWMRRETHYRSIASISVSIFVGLDFRTAGR